MLARQWLYTICGVSTFDPIVKGNPQTFKTNIYLSSIITTNNFYKQKKHSVMTLYLITRIFWLTCFAIISYALPITEENDAVVSFSCIISFKKENVHCQGILSYIVHFQNSKCLVSGTTFIIGKRTAAVMRQFSLKKFLIQYMFLSFGKICDIIMISIIWNLKKIEDRCELNFNFLTW